MSQNGLDLVVGNDTYHVRPEWIPRWIYLSELAIRGVNRVEWRESSSTEIQQWIRLNERMDYREDATIDHHANPNTKWTLLPVSSFWRTLQYMEPEAGDYLLSIYIDPDLTIDQRLRYYIDLGYVIRTIGVQYPYATNSLHVNYIHNNCNLYRDLAYGIRLRGFIPRSLLGPMVMKEVLRSDLNTLTGILHTAWIFQHSVDYIPEVVYGEEIPWELIRWRDMVELCPQAFVLGEDTLQIIHAIVHHQNQEERQRRISTRATIVTYSLLGYGSELLEDRLNSIIVGKTNAEVADTIAKMIKGDVLTRRRYGGNTYGPTVAQEQNLRVMLAGLKRSDIPQVALAGASIVTSFDSIDYISSPDEVYSTGELPITSVPFQVTDEAKLITSSPATLLDRLYQWNDQFPEMNSIAVLELIGVGEEVISSNVRLDDSVTFLINAAVARLRINQIITEDRYRDVVEVIASSLGTECLTQISDSALYLISLPGTSNSNIQRLDLLVNEALVILESNSSRGLVRWPIVV